MSEPARPQAWVGLMWVSAVALACGIAAVLAPQWLLRMCTKEGPAEAAGQVILLGAALGWAVVRTREGRGAAWIAAGCAVVLAEELDWGMQLGVPLFAEFFGVHNLHNSLHGATYILFALPWVYLFGAALLGKTKPRWIPPRPDAFAFAIVVCVAGVSLALPSIWEQALDELSELLLYVLLAVSGMRRVGVSGS